MHKRRIPCVLCAVALGGLAALASAQAKSEKSHDALATARAKAKHENQRVLLLLTGADEGGVEGSVEDALVKALGNYRELGKLQRYEYQLAAQPAGSLAAKALRQRLGLAALATPALVILDTEDKVLGTLGAAAMTAEGALVPGAVRTFLESHKCAPLDARKVLAAGVAAAKSSKRRAFVYLSAPW